MATAPCATVGEGPREDAPAHTGVAFEKQERHRNHHPVERGGLKNQGAAAAARAPATRGAKKKGGGNGGGGLKSPRSAFLQHGAALARQRLKRQEEIARENMRMERRLKVIREANPGHHHAGGPRRASAPSGFGGKHGGRAGDDAGRPRQGQRRHRRRLQRDGAILAGGSVHHPAIGGREEACHPDGGGGGGAGANAANYGNNAAEAGREAGWRELYRRREALASAVERAAAGVAETRAEVEALRAKTLCTEANARRCAAAWQFEEGRVCYACRKKTPCTAD